MLNSLNPPFTITKSLATPSYNFLINFYHNTLPCFQKIGQDTIAFHPFASVGQNVA